MSRKSRKQQKTPHTQFMEIIYKTGWEGEKGQLPGERNWHSGKLRNPPF